MTDPAMTTEKSTRRVVVQAMRNPSSVPRITPTNAAMTATTRISDRSSISWERVYSRSSCGLNRRFAGSRCSSAAYGESGKELGSNRDAVPIPPIIGAIPGL